MLKYLAPVAALLLTACSGPIPDEPAASVQQPDVTLEPWGDFVSNATIGIHIVAADGTILWANPADYEPLGLTASQYIGHDIRDFHASQETIATMLSILGGGGELVNYPAKLLAADGSIVYVSIRSRFSSTYGHTRCFTSVVPRPIWQLLWAEQQGQ